jgi:hypothetical protein
MKLLVVHVNAKVAQIKEHNTGARFYALKCSEFEISPEFLRPYQV